MKRVEWTWWTLLLQVIFIWALVLLYVFVIS